MTALEQALIKAYRQQGVGRPQQTAGHEGLATQLPPTETVAKELRRPAPPLSPAAQPVPLSPAVPLSQALAELGSKPADTASTSASASASVSVERLLSDLMKPVGQDVTRAAAVASPRTIVHDVLPTATVETNPLSGESLTFRTDLGSAGLAGYSLSDAPSPHLAQSLADSSADSSAASEQEPVQAAWHAMLQVDRFVWPTAESRLQADAAQPMEQLTTGLNTILNAGRRVLGFASNVDGEGVTTLVAAAAQQLAAQGLRVVLVDANLANPQLARSLGLLPQVGWEEIQAGRLPLEEVVVESIADQISVLPLLESPTDLSADAIAQSPIVKELDALAEHYDAVLVDLGSLSKPKSGGRSPADGIARHVDGVILVQNVRTTTPDQLAALEGDLAAAGIVHAGTIQNFVTG